MSKKKSSVLTLLIIILALSIGFALLTATLKINGSGTITGGTWDVHWENVDNEDGVTPINPATIDPSDNTNVTFEADVTIPGDYYEFTVDAVNRGTIDAMLKKIDVTINGTSVDDISDYLEFTIKYADGTDYEENDLLPKGNKITYKVRLQYKKDISEAQLDLIPEEGEPFVGDITPVYVQANDDAVDKGNTEIYHIFKTGNYFYMCADKEYATTDTPGFDKQTPTADQCLWRVISLNNDGTMDAVSEYVSTNTISINAADGFKNYAAGLQDIASCYAKEGYTVRTRNFGYDGQTLSIADTSMFDGTLNPSDNPGVSPPTTTITPKPTSGTGEEYLNGVGGDNLYLRDYQLVGNVYKDDPIKYSQTGLRARTKSGSIKEYWTSSRGYRYYTGIDGYMCFGSINIGTNGTFNEYGFRLWWLRYQRWEDSYTGTYHVRPIITLGSKVNKSTGTGTLDDPYLLQ